MKYNSISRAAEMGLKQYSTNYGGGQRGLKSSATQWFGAIYERSFVGKYGSFLTITGVIRQEDIRRQQMVFNVLRFIYDHFRHAGTPEKPSFQQFYDALADEADITFMSTWGTQQTHNLLNGWLNSNPEIRMNYLNDVLMDEDLELESFNDVVMLAAKEEIMEIGVILYRELMAHVR